MGGCSWQLKESLPLIAAVGSATTAVAVPQYNDCGIRHLSRSGCKDLVTIVSSLGRVVSPDYPNYLCPEL